MRKTVLNRLETMLEEIEPVEKFDSMTNDQSPEILEDGSILAAGYDKPNKFEVVEYHISQATPATIMDGKSNDTQYAAVVFLCKDQSKNELFTIAHNYYVDSKEEYDMLHKNPLHDKVNFVSKRIVMNMISNTVTSYISDIDIYYNENAENMNEQFYLYALKNESNIEKVYKFYISSNLFCVFGYTDNYLNHNLETYHDLYASCMLGGQFGTRLANLCWVDTIDSIVDMCATDSSITNNTNDVLTVFKIFEFEEHHKNIYKILISLNFGKKYPKRKFKGQTYQKLEEVYTSDNDQYAAQFSFHYTFKNIDKEYMIVCATNSHSITKLFFLDADAQKKLQQLVEEY